MDWTKSLKPRTEACRTCGVDIRGQPKYAPRWTQCSVCYWKSRLDNQKPLDELLRRRAEVRAQLKSLPVRIERLQAAIRQSNVELVAKTPWWWRELLAAFTGWPRTDPVLVGHWQRLHEVEADLRQAENEHSRTESRIQEHKKVKKRFLSAQLTRSAHEVRERLEAQEHEKFCLDALTNLGREFDRIQFFIQGRDYKRGNSIDNYFRKTLSEIVIAAFEHRCVFCGAPDDLTFDHYGLPKNEGGNFVLILADKASIRLNIVVLCRGCNAMKGERSYLNYFSDAQRDQVTIYQRALLENLLHDQNFLALIKKWRRPN